MLKSLTVWITTNWKILKEVRIPDHLSCLLKHLYVAQEATGRILHGTTDWFKTEKGVRKSYTISLCSFNLYAEYMMRNAGLDESQARIRIAGRTINSIRYADDTTPVAEVKGTKKPFDEGERGE